MKVDYVDKGHGTAAPNMDGWKAAIKDKTTASVTGESKNYTIGINPQGWICPLCGRSVNPSYMHCSCGGWRYSPQPTWTPPTTPCQPWYTTITCKEETSTRPINFCGGFMNIEGMD